jgi:hypothetical protein
MSETVWILLTVAGWIVVMSAISAFANLAKESDRARGAVVADRRRERVFGDVREKVLH